MGRLSSINVLAAVVVVAGAFGATRAQSRTGVWEGEIQDPKRPIVVNVDFNALKISFSGGPPAKMNQPVAKDGQSARFAVINGAQTLMFSGQSDGRRINGDVDTGARSIPFWLEPLPVLPKPADCGEAWRQDLDVVLSRFLRYDRSFSEPRRAAAQARLQALRSKVSGMSNQSIIVELARAVALSGNAHTRLYLMRNRTEVRRVPIRVWWFGRELRIVRAATEYSDLAGCRVDAIGRWPVATALQRTRDIKAGNLSWQRYMSSYFLTSPDLLFGAGLLRDPEHLPLTVNCNGRPRHLELKPLPLQRSTAAVEAWWDLAPAYRTPNADFKSGLTADKAPLYLEHPDRNYWVEYLETPSIVYVQYNRAQEMASDSMSDFIRRVGRMFDEHQVKGFIVDVRFNTGGDAGVGTPLVETFAPRLHVPVVVLTSRATFSAGITHTVQWKQFANASIVGEPTGDGLDLWSEGGNLLLPNSGLTVHYANGFHNYSQKDYPANKPYFLDLNVASIAPDLLVEPTWADYSAGRDPVLAAAIARIQRSK